MAHYIYTAITVDTTPLVIGEYTIQTIPVNDRGIPIRQAELRPGYGWQALWWKANPEAGAQHRAHPSNGALLFSDESSALEAAFREAETAAQNSLGSPRVFLFA